MGSAGGRGIRPADVFIGDEDMWFIGRIPGIFGWGGTQHMGRMVRSLVQTAISTGHERPGIDIAFLLSVSLSLTILAAPVWPGTDAVGTALDPAGGGRAESRRSAEPVLPTAAPQPPGAGIRDRLESGGEGPEMVVIPAGRFLMGCVSGRDCARDEEPVHEVVLAAPFAMSRYEITFEDYDKFTSPDKVDDEG